MASDDLIQTLEHSSEPLRATRWSIQACAVLFVAFASGAGIIDTLWPVPVPEPVGLEKQAEDELRATANFADGSLAALTERDLGLASRVKHWLGPAHAELLYRTLDEIKSELVIGKDGWLFLRNRILPTTLSIDEVTGGIARLLASLDRLLAAQGVDMIVVPIPRKSVTCRAWLPATVDPQPAFEHRLQAQLARHGLLAVDLLSVYRTVEEGTELFHVVGSHWTDTAQMLAAEEACRVAGVLVPEAERETFLKQTKGQVAEGDLFRMAGIEPTRSKTLFPLSPSFREFRHDGQRVKRARPDSMSPIALVGTSFSAERQFPGFVGAFAQQDIWNAASPGQDPFTVTARFLAQHADDLPELLIFEQPLHLLGVYGATRALGASYARAGALPATPIVVHNSRSALAEQFVGKPHAWGAPSSLLTCPPGALIHTGDGIVRVRLRGRVVAGKAQLAVRTQKVPVRADWPDGATEVNLPLISFGGDASGEIHVVHAGSPGTEVALDNVRFVTPLDVQRGAELVAGEVRSDADGWSLELRPATELVLEPFSGLWMDLFFRGRDPFDVAVQVHVVDDAATPLRLAAARPRKRTTYLMNLAAFTGKRIDKVLLSGRGAPPQNVVERALIAPGVKVRSRDN